MRIAILNVSTDDAPYARRHPDDGARFAALMRSARPDWDFPIHRSFEGDFPAGPGAADGFLVTGSPTSVNDDLPWVHRLMDFIRAAEAARAPLFGACFGHQAAAKALGGAVGPNPGGCMLGMVETEFFAPRGWMAPFQPRLRLHCGNYEQVTRLPEAAETVGRAEGCPVAAFAIGDHVFTTQFHPDMPRGYVEEMIAFMEPNEPAGTIARARASLAGPDEAARMAEWMARFWEQGRRA